MEKLKFSFRPKLQITRSDTSWIACSFLVWIFFSFSLYSLLYVVREVFRYLTYALWPHEFLELTSAEHYFFNFFFASVSCIASFGQAINLLIKKPSFQSKFLSYKKSSIYNDQTNLSWYVLLWVVRLGTIYGIFGPLFHFIDLYRDYKFIFIAIPVVLFLNQWITLNRVFKTKGLKWMAIFALILFGMSFSFSRINLTDYKAFNASITKNIVPYNYSINVPVASETMDLIDRHDAEELFFGFTKNDLDTLPNIIAKDHPLEILTYQSLAEYVARKAEEHSMYSFRPLIFILNIDKRVKTGDLKLLKQSLSKEHSQQVLYSTISSEKHIKHFFKREGLTAIVNQNCDQLLLEKIVSLKKAKGKHIKVDLPKCGLIPPVNVMEKPTIQIRLSRNQFYISNTLKNIDEIYSEIYEFINPKEYKRIIEFDIDNESDYDHYIKLLNTTKSAINDRKDEIIYAQYGITYRDIKKNPYDPRVGDIMQTLNSYSISLIEWTDAEKEIVKHIRESM